MLADELLAAQMRELARAVSLAPVRPTPNPRVGCRILSANGELLAQGIHGSDGVKHAEVIALEAAGEQARGATAIVTLEPCSHTGRTSPCVEALLAAGIDAVVFSHADETQAGGGAARLREAGIKVVGGVETSATLPLIEPWLHFQHTGRPFVTLKLAATLDGYVAAPDGSSRWITGSAAREHVHRLRAQADAVLVGTGTAMADDPRLDVRLPGDWPQPARYVLGERKLPLHSNLQQLRTRDLQEAMRMLAAAGVQHLLVEGGATIARAFLDARLVDRLVWFSAPKLLGGGLPAVSGLGISNIEQADQWRIVEVAEVGGDLLIDLRPDRAAD